MPPDTEQRVAEVLTDQIYRDLLTCDDTKALPFIQRRFIAERIAERRALGVARAIEVGIATSMECDCEDCLVPGLAAAFMKLEDK